MEGLLFVLIMLWVLNRLGKKKTEQKKWAAAARKRRETFQQMVNETSQPAPAHQSEKPVSPSPFRGSLEYVSMEGHGSDEGEDTCDPVLGHERVTPVEPDSVYAQEIGGGLPPITPQSLVQGVVMSEILNRPRYRR